MLQWLHQNASCQHCEPKFRIPLGNCWKKTRPVLYFMWSRFFVEKKYRIVSSRNTCYHSGNQKFCILKSRLVTSRIFFLETKLFCLSRQKAEIFSIFMIQNFVKPHKILAFYLDKQKGFVPKNEVRTNGDMLLLATLRQIHCSKIDKYIIFPLPKIHFFTVFQFIMHFICRYSATLTVLQL